jgi:hypothetical protein
MATQSTPNEANRTASGSCDGSALLRDFIRTRTAIADLAEVAKNNELYSDGLFNLANDELMRLMRRKNDLETKLLDAMNRER